MHQWVVHQFGRGFCGFKHGGHLIGTRTQPLRQLHDQQGGHDIAPGQLSQDAARAVRALEGFEQNARRETLTLQHLARGQHEAQPHQRHAAHHQQGADHWQADQQQGEGQAQAQQSDEVEGLTAADQQSLPEPDIALCGLDDAELHADGAWRV